MLIYIDMDDVICDFTRAFNLALKRNPRIQFPQSQYGFYENLQPIEGAIESVQLLIESSEYDVYILTAPSVLNPLCYTEKRVWVEKYFGIEFTEKLIISPNKGLLKGDVLVDDNTQGRGQESFEGELIHFASDRYPTWAEVRLALGLNE